MTRFIDWVSATGVLVPPLISAIFGWIESRADLAFLLVLVFALGSGALWSHLSPRFERSPDSLVTLLMRWQLMVSLVTTVIFAPLVVYFTGLAWYWVVLGAVLIILSAEIMSALQMWHSHIEDESS